MATRRSNARSNTNGRRGQKGGRGRSSSSSRGHDIPAAIAREIGEFFDEVDGWLQHKDLRYYDAYCLAIRAVGNAGSADRVISFLITYYRQIQANPHHVHQGDMRSVL